MVEEKQPTDAQRVAQMEAGVGAEHIAAVYAEALLGASESTHTTEAILEVFDSFITDVLDPFPDLEALLASGLVSHEEKTKVLERVLADRAPEVFLDFLKVVSRHGRLDCLRVIRLKAQELYEQMRGRVRVQLTTPTPLEDGLAERIAQSLRELVGGEPVLTCLVDPTLIGGAVVRVGDTVYDGSIATQLETMRKQMIDRSVHEIQSRRDRFRYPAGN